jgi:hypothetical protein
LQGAIKRTHLPGIQGGVSSCFETPPSFLAQGFHRLAWDLRSLAPVLITRSPVEAAL